MVAAVVGLVLLALALACGLAWWMTRAGAAPPRPVQEAPGAGMHFFDPVVVAAALRAAVRLADHTHCSYLAHSRYPHHSRPAGHHPDQLRPNQPVLEAHPMRREDGDSDTGVLLQTSQSRVYLAAGEAVTFSLRARDTNGQALPLVVTGALAQGMRYGAERPAPRVGVAFTEGDDGAWSARLAPGQGGLAGFHGTIRTEVRYSADGRKGVVLFDVVHSPLLPARWTGEIAESTGNGGLRFLLHLDVEQAGRYVVSGRVDDAAGQPFVLASFNEVLGTGVQQVPLEVFGKLLHDGAPRLPLVLRDVEGHLLRESTDPDRLLLPRLEGKVFASRIRTLDGIPMKNGTAKKEAVTWPSTRRTGARPMLACGHSTRSRRPRQVPVRCLCRRLSKEPAAGARPSSTPGSRSTGSPRHTSALPTVSLYPCCAFYFPWPPG